MVTCDSTRDLVVSKAGRASPAVRRRAPVSCPLARWGALVQARATLRPGTRHEPYDLRKRLRWRLVVAPLPTGLVPDAGALRGISVRTSSLTRHGATGST